MTNNYNELCEDVCFWILACPIFPLKHFCVCKCRAAYLPLTVCYILLALHPPCCLWLVFLRGLLSIMQDVFELCSSNTLTAFIRNKDPLFHYFHTYPNWNRTRKYQTLIHCWKITLDVFFSCTWMRWIHCSAITTLLLQEIFDTKPKHISCDFVILILKPNKTQYIL